MSLVAVALDRQVALADWQRDRNRLLGGFAVASTLVLALALALYAVLKQRERVETERRQARDMLDSALDAMSDGFVMWDEDDRLITCNQQYRDIYKVSAPALRPGVRFDELIREGVRLGQYPQATGDVEEFVRQTIEWRRNSDEALERELPDGRWILIRERPTSKGGIVGIRTDITALKQASAKLAAANARVLEAMAEVQLQNEMLTRRDRELRTQNVLFDAALNNMSQGLVMVDAEHKVIVCNEQFLGLFGLSSRIGCSRRARFRDSSKPSSVMADRRPTSSKNLCLEQSMLGASRHSGTFIRAGKKGRALAISQRPLADGGWVATYEDVTEQQRAEQRIRFMAHHDALTSLPNRVLFRARMDEALGKPGGRRGRPGAALSRSRQIQGCERYARPSGRRQAARGGGRSVAKLRS